MLYNNSNNGIQQADEGKLIRTFDDSLSPIRIIIIIFNRGNVLLLIVCVSYQQ